MGPHIGHSPEATPMLHTRRHDDWKPLPQGAYCPACHAGVGDHSCAHLTSPRVRVLAMPA